MNELIQSPLTIGGIVTVLGGVITKLYLDSKAKDKVILDLSQLRVDDLKAIDAAKDGKDEKIMTLVQLIYNKLESEKK